MAADPTTAYERTWTEAGWRVQRARGGHLIPIETRDGTDCALLIEDDDVAAAVCQRMLDHGVPLVE